MSNADRILIVISLSCLIGACMCLKYMTDQNKQSIATIEAQLEVLNNDQQN